MMSSVGDASHVIAIDYRGFGDSSSAIPTEKSLKVDSLTAYDWIVAQGVDPSKIVLVGHSLGTGVASGLAYHLTQKGMAFGGLVLLSAYASIADAAIGYPMIPLLLPFRGWSWTEKMIRGVLIDKWNSTECIRSLKCPILIIHGKRDFEILPWQAKALFLEAVGGRMGESLVSSDGYWELRNKASKYSISELSGVQVTPLAPDEGELWSSDITKNVSGRTAVVSNDIWFLQVTHGGHNTLSKFQVVQDCINEWVENALTGSSANRNAFVASKQSPPRKKA